MKIIGLSGTFASGKDTLAHHLVQKFNYLHISTGDMVRAVAESKYGNTERPTLQVTANELRESRGPGVLADLAMERYNDQKDEYSGVVISGVRSLGEAKAIQDAGGTVVFVDAPVEVRYQRIQDRQRANEEDLSLDEFIKSEELEINKAHDNPAVQDLIGVKERADLQLVNGHNIEEFFSDAENKLGL